MLKQEDNVDQTSQLKPKYIYGTKGKGAEFNVNVAPALSRSKARPWNTKALWCRATSGLGGNREAYTIDGCIYLYMRPHLLIHGRIY